MLSTRDIREFRGFLRNATDRQVQGIYDKEKRAGRDDYAELAVAEAEKRGIFLELIDDDDEGSSHSTKKSRVQLDREIAAALKGTGGGSRGRRSHAVVKSTVPGITKWNMFAGGTAAAEGKHSYSYVTGIKGEYHISPISTKYGRHAGYKLDYAATGGSPRGSHSGLWHDLGTHRSPAGAAKAAREHYARSFE